MIVLVSVFDVVMLDELSIDMLKWDSDNLVFIMMYNCWLSMNWNEMSISMMSIMGYYLVVYSW